MQLKYRYAVLIIFFIILGVSAYTVYSSMRIQPSAENSEIQPGQEDWIRTKGRINILLLGTDQDLETNSRTDTIILASVDTVQKKVSLLSIPRDTRVNIPGFGENKINAANLLGGTELVKATISNLIKVPIDYYIITNFEGFKDIVDTLGGVEIDVEQNMRYRAYDGMIDLKKGVQRLDGEKALQYVRFRHDKLGDITRTQRQQKFLTALAKEMIQAKTILKLPALIPKLKEAVGTDLSVTQMIGLAKELANYDLSTITVQTLPGNFVDLNGASYWYVDEAKAHQVVLEVFAGNSTDVIDNDIKVNTGSQTRDKKEEKKDPSPVNNEEGKKEVDSQTPEVIIIDPIPLEEQTDVTPPAEKEEENIDENSTDDSEVKSNDHINSTQEEPVDSTDIDGKNSLSEQINNPDNPPDIPVNKEQL
ncbi:MAG: LCP family protein [Bacillota bacterium]|jgi:LCP family protein required for cell wall assembly|nr:LytR family transcriptional regulator [Clostridia bacterium]